MKHIPDEDYDGEESRLGSVIVALSLISAILVVGIMTGILISKLF